MMMRVVQHLQPLLCACPTLCFTAFLPLPGTYDLRVCCNGLLSGLVTVTCICGFVGEWANSPS
jgi:ammonia channel protein AmtB